jgi:Zn-dependent M28 family amino/carboxypeptidase
VRQVESANVLALLPGSDPERRRETVVITAHHDHLGMAPEGAAGADRIYNGAVDNASGAAVLLALARAYTRLGAPPRSMLFAAVAAEEQGLLGSAFLAAHPPVPAGCLAAVINVDGINVWGRTRDVTMVGWGKSSLDEVVGAVAAWQGRVVKPDQFPDRGFYYRSDQFSLARIGVPGIYLDAGLDFLDRPPDWGRTQIEEWERIHYHQPSDEYRKDWDLSGAIEDARLLFYAGLLIARSPALPAWRAGDEFEAARKEALGKVGSGKAEGGSGK